ncbi:MAG: malto-oligosyltrehalose trehalohydrolase [Pseudomonadota bacterium]
MTSVQHNHQSSARHIFGARLLDDAHTQFRFWAPDKRTVILEIEGHPPQPMQALDNGWFTLEVECSAGARYRYRIDAALAVPDPASQAQAGDLHDASIVVDHSAYRWQHTNWKGRPWHETVLYELHVGALGGFAGTMAQLPALAALGITAVELMPVADFPGKRNWGYDGVLPYAPDAAYGTPDELKALIDTAHGLNVMVFLDVVYNHFGPDGNYLGAYASPFFREDIHTPWGQAIDFRRQEIRDFFTNNLLHWIQDYRFDGLRLDAVHAICESDWLPEASRAVREATAPGRHVHLVLENDHNDPTLLEGPAAGLYDAQWNDDGHHALHVLLTGEREGYYNAYATEPAEQLARCLAEGFIFQGQAALHPGAALRGQPSAHLPPTAFVMFLQNHDQIGNRAFGDRLTKLANPEALRAAQALLLLAPSIPLIFMGEEFGSTQNFLYFTDHAAPDLAAAVRDGRRLEFARFAAFADPATRDLIPDPNSVGTFEQSIPKISVTATIPTTPTTTGQTASSSASSPASWQTWMSDLLTLRRIHIVPGLPGARAIGAKALGPSAVWASWLLGNGTTLTLILNLATTALDISTDLVVIGSQATILFDPNRVTDAIVAGQLPACSLLAFLEPAT